MQSDDEKTFVPRQPSDTRRPLLGNIYKPSRPSKDDNSSDSSDFSSTEDENEASKTKADDIVSKYLSFENPMRADEEEVDENSVPFQSTPIDILSYFADSPSSTTRDDLNSASKEPVFEPIPVQIAVPEEESIPLSAAIEGESKNKLGTEESGDETDAELSDNEKERLKAKGILFLSL